MRLTSEWVYVLHALESPIYSGSVLLGEWLVIVTYCLVCTRILQAAPLRLDEI